MAHAFWCKVIDPPCALFVNAGFFFPAMREIVQEEIRPCIYAPCPMPISSVDLRCDCVETSYWRIKRRGKGFLRVCVLIEALVKALGVSSVVLFSGGGEGGAASLLCLSRVSYFLRLLVLCAFSK